MIEVLFSLLDFGLEIINFELSSFTRVSCPNTSCLSLVWNAMRQLLLLLEVRNMSLNSLLYEAGICCQEGQLTRVKNLLFLLDLVLELLQALSI